MTTVLHVGEPSAELAALSSAVEGYLAGTPVSGLSDADLVSELRCLELARRRLQAHDNPIIAELDRRGLGASYGTRSTKGLLQDVLRLSPGQAHRRVDAARLLAQRVSLTGEVLAPVLPATAAAYDAGLISPEHVHAVIATVDDLPGQLPTEEFEQVDQILAKVAEQCPPRSVCTAGIQILEMLDARDHRPSEQDQQRTRRLILRRRRDGAYDISGRLTPDCGAETEAVLNALAAPRPGAVDDTGHEAADDRSATQRLHDALQDVMGLALRADTLDTTGRRAQLIITGHAPTAHPDTTSQSPCHQAPCHESPCHQSPWNGVASNDSGDDPDIDRPAGECAGDSSDIRPNDPHTPPSAGPDVTPALSGTAWTSFGQAVSARTAMWLCDTAMIADVTLAPNGRVLKYGQTRRFGTKAQIRALIARDLGCSFPGCHQPPQWCDAHHIIAWHDGGPTDLDNLTLLCGYHHRNFQRIGWTCRIPNGVPEWIPPPHVDPHQTPRINRRLRFR